MSDSSERKRGPDDEALPGRLNLAHDSFTCGTMHLELGSHKEQIQSWPEYQSVLDTYQKLADRIYAEGFTWVETPKKDQRPDRVVKSWLRTRKSRGHITDDDYKTVAKHVKTLYDQGTTDADVLKDAASKMLETLRQDVSKTHL